MKLICDKELVKVDVRQVAQACLVKIVQEEHWTIWSKSSFGWLLLFSKWT